MIRSRYPRRDGEYCGTDDSVFVMGGYGCENLKGIEEYE